MARERPRRSVELSWRCLGLAALSAECGEARGADVSGVVRMPDVCSPAASPAVVYLTPADRARGESALESASGSSHVGRDTRSAELVLVNQRGLQFVPRVQAIALGQTVRFTNQDGETHNVHVVSPVLRVQSSDGAGTAAGFHARPCGRDEACV